MVLEARPVLKMQVEGSGHCMKRVLRAVSQGVRHHVEMPCLLPFRRVDAHAEQSAGSTVEQVVRHEERIPKAGQLVASRSGGAREAKERCLQEIDQLDVVEQNRRARVTASPQVPFALSGAPDHPLPLFRSEETQARFRLHLTKAIGPAVPQGAAEVAQDIQQVLHRVPSESPRDARPSGGAAPKLLVAEHDADELTRAGRIGSGFVWAVGHPEQGSWEPRVQLSPSRGTT